MSSYVFPLSNGIKKTTFSEMLTFEKHEGGRLFRDIFQTSWLFCVLSWINGAVYRLKSKWLGAGKYLINQRADVSFLESQLH